jgi:two-component system, OmpR family, osmolarity sensor histidine kinase EnvZ
VTGWNLFKLPNTLFARTASTLTFSLLLLAIIFIVSSVYFVMAPVVKRSADDLAALLVLAAETWHELPIKSHADFAAELKKTHDIILLQGEALTEKENNIPGHIYLNLLRESLETRVKQNIYIDLKDEKTPLSRVWINFPVADEFVRFGISVERVGAHPSVALIAIAISILLFVIGTTLILASRLSRPLETLSKATSMIGKDQQITIPENRGAEEFRTLARNFNLMSQEVRSLLENRTTLLAGISHDLRTPLTRLRLALEIYPTSSDPEIKYQLESNIKEMEQLLDHALQLARGISKEENLKPVDLVKMLSILASQLEAQYQQQKPSEQSWISFQADPETGSSRVYAVPEQSLLRIIGNLLENALRYGNDQPVAIQIGLLNGDPLIAVMDRGPGIPEQELVNVFRPFYRIEQSRNMKTGGSGLGLAIVQQLSLAYGWEVSMHKRVGGGNEVRLWLKNTKQIVATA